MKIFLTPCKKIDNASQATCNQDGNKKSEGAAVLIHKRYKQRQKHGNAEIEYQQCNHVDD